jgi:IS4 transposase
LGWNPRYGHADDRGDRDKRLPTPIPLAAQQRELAFLTNIHHLAASTVAAIYKERWQIELLFKALKQHLKIKTFVGTSENAVQIQIWTALIAMLLLRYLQLKSTWPWSLSNLGALLRFNLLTYRDLWAWLDAPFQVPRTEPQPEQLVLVP